jgi:hypothetical protein
MSPAELSKFIKGEAKPENLSELRIGMSRRGSSTWGSRKGWTPSGSMSRAGASSSPTMRTPRSKEALSPLLRLREAQAGGRFRVYAGAEGYRPDDSKSAWLARPPRKMGPGPADPDKVPYYLLICGSPEQIPYRFQSQLDVQYAVGRIHFDTLDEYANYARSVVEAETGSLRLSRRMQLFGVANPLDQATN